MKASAPAKSTGTLNIGFGMVTVTCGVYAGIEDSAAKIKRNWRTEGGAHVGYLKVNKDTGAEISQHDIYDVYVCEDGTEVPLSNEEIAEALGEDNGTANVVGFYPSAQITQYVTQNLLQVRPKKATTKKNPFDKPFALLMRAMALTDTFALITFTLRGTPQLGALDSEGYLRVVRWENEVREARDLSMIETEVSEAEEAMAVSLVEVMQGKKAPLMECEAVEQVRAYAEAKAEAMGGGGETVVETPDNDAKVTDLLAALQGSIDKAKQQKQEVTA